ncbi:flagellar basal body rod protein FlgC [Tepidibacillus sp. HK-1]|uniref:flagellar basal body rod protein FlgC n=1 Tax=Tepidibacillus sp. HK-1 TaxID=1883407 RepID=UPI000852ABC7|nr:flagellar basal body rod protein FlgC [Tepidibacillus sp. HK-1]GBF11596.1 flagellar basal-body rod protein FlgC [Tepidibacillus sp. HK-1]
MKLFSTMDISASALTAQRLRMDVISSNIANAETTRDKYVDGKWQPYTRKMVALQPNTSLSFDTVLNQYTADTSYVAGVRVSKIVEDKTPFKQVYQPNHPDADENGFISLPNVDILKEMVDMISATRAYEANVTALNSTKSMLMKALEIGK